MVIDCREENEFKVSRIPGAFNIPFSQFETDRAKHVTEKKHMNFLVNTLDLEVTKHLGRKLHATDEVDLVCYCSVGYRSSVVAERILELRDDGHLPPGIQAHNLRGSIFQWASEGRNLSRSEPSNDRGECVETKVTTVHPFSRIWGSLTLPFSLWRWE